MQALNQITASLQEQILLLEATGQVGGSRLATAILNAQQMLQATINIAKGLHQPALINFLNDNQIVLQQLQSSSIISQATAIMQQRAVTYQDTIVPMLTRLHNLSEDNGHKITLITALGNEIITYSAQMNQFNEKFNLQEKILAMFGIILMLSSISMMIIILSKKQEISLLTALVVTALGCSVCKKAMQAHVSDPGTDLIASSVKKMGITVLEVAKDSAGDTAVLRELLQVSASLQEGVVKVKAVEVEREVEVVEQKVEDAVVGDDDVTFMGKLKGMLDLFNVKK